MCVCEMWANFISFMSVSRQPLRPVDQIDRQIISYFDVLPLEILEKIILYLSYDQIAKLRMVNRQLNFLCAKFLNQAYFTIKTDIENYIFDSYQELQLGGKFREECIKYFNRSVHRHRRDYAPQILKIMFANKLLLILLIHRHGIYRYMFYRRSRNSKQDFVFMYGNLLDFVGEKMHFLTNTNNDDNEITIMHVAYVRPPSKVSKHLDNIIAFYANKSRHFPTSTSFEKYMKINCRPAEETYVNRMKPIVSAVEFLLYATYHIAFDPKTEGTKFDSFDRKSMFEEREEIFTRVMLFINE